jgi:BRCA1-like protein
MEGVMLVRNPRTTERGMSAIPFVISLLLVAGLAIAWYRADQATTDLAAKAKADRETADRLQKQFEEVNNRLLLLTTATGYDDAEGKPDQALIQKALTEFLDKWREKLTCEFTADKYTSAANGPAVEKLAGDKVRVNYLATKEQITNPNLQQVLAILEPAAARMQFDVKRYVENLDAERKSKAEALEAGRKALAEKDTQYTALQGTNEQQKRAYEEQIKELRDQVTAKEQALAAVQTEIDQVKSTSEKALAKLTSDVNQKAAELASINRREKPFISEGPDGEVVSAGAGIAIINRGKKDMLMPGTVFTVLGRIKGGSLVPKGSLRVVICSDESAQCTILDETPGNPIGGTDLIQSLTYSPNRQMRFCLIGEFRKMGRAQAERRLKDLGAAVDASVTAETHYLVVGSPAAGEVLEDSEAWKLAKQFGVQVLTEAELASMTLY